MIEYRYNLVAENGIFARRRMAFQSLLPLLAKEDKDIASNDYVLFMTTEFAGETEVEDAVAKFLEKYYDQPGCNDEGGHVLWGIKVRMALVFVIATMAESLGYHFVAQQYMEQFAVIVPDEED